MFQNMVATLNSSGRNIASGSLSLPTSNTSYTIDTGLSSIKRFIGWHTNSESLPLQTVIVYDADIDTKQHAYSCYNTTPNVQIAYGTIGTTPSTYQLTITNITNGTVTITNGSNTTSNKCNYGSTFYWYAE